MGSDTIYRQDAIDAINTWDKFGINERSQVVRWHEGLEPYVKLSDVVWAIEKLPSAQLKQTDCCYCHEDSDGYVTPLEKNSHAFIHFGMNGWCLELRAKGWHGNAKSIIVLCVEVD